MRELHLSADFERWPEFIDLSADLGVGRAVFALARLFVDLAYEVEVTRRVGLLRLQGFKRYLSSLAGCDAEKVGAAMEQSRLLVREGEDFICPRFAMVNAHLDPANISAQRQGAAVSAYVRRMDSRTENITQLTLKIPVEVWKRPDGEPLAHEDIRRITTLIIACDSALGKPERPSTAEGFPTTLVHDAWRVLRDFTADQIELVIRRVAKYRISNHPAIPPSTEQLLAGFREIKEALMK